MKSTIGGYIMEKATVTSVNYEKSDTIEKQGKQKDIQKYLNDGYYVKVQRNGYWVLVKPSQVQVTLSNSKITRTYNMKEEIREHYNRTNVTEALARTFFKDLTAGKISINMDSEGMYTFN
jgi:hypothetical protein